MHASAAYTNHIYYPNNIQRSNELTQHTSFLRPIFAVQHFNSPSENCLHTTLCFNLEVSIITLQTEQQPVKHKEVFWLACHWHDYHPNTGKHVTVEEVGILNKLGRLPCTPLLCLSDPAPCQYNSSPYCTIHPSIQSDKLRTAPCL